MFNCNINPPSHPLYIFLFVKGHGEHDFRMDEKYTLERSPIYSIAGLKQLFTPAVWAV